MHGLWCVIYMKSILEITWLYLKKLCYLLIFKIPWRLGLSNSPREEKWCWCSKDCMWGVHVGLLSCCDLLTKGINLPVMKGLWRWPHCVCIKLAFWFIADAARIFSHLFHGSVLPLSVAITLSLAVQHWSLHATAVLMFLCSSIHPELCMKVLENNSLVHGYLSLLGKQRDSRK